MEADPNNSNNYWSGGHYTFAMFASKTNNACSTWTRYNLAPVGIVSAIAINPLNSNIVYAGGNPGVFKTTNAGSQWNSVSTGLNDTIKDLAIHPVNTNTIYAATNGGVYKTINGGTNWFNTGCSNATAIIIDPTNPETLYASVMNGVYCSYNGGGNWIDMSTGLNGAQVTSLGINPGQFLFAGTIGKAMYRFTLPVGVKENETCSIRPSLNIVPNPAIDIIKITYTAPVNCTATMKLFDISGRVIADVYDGNLKPGLNEICFNAGELINGIYFLHCNIGAETITEKIVVTR